MVVPSRAAGLPGPEVLLTMASRGPRSAGAVDPHIIKVRPRRRPGLWAVAVIVVAVLALFCYSVATDGAYAWPTYRRHLLDREFARAALVTLELTGIATAIALVVGGLLAAMRVCGNVVLRAVSWAYLWLFRSTPVYLQLAFWGLVTQVYGRIDLSVPGQAPVRTLDLTTVVTAFVAACVGLGLNAGAYQAEVFGSGFASVSTDQREAAVLLGMSPGLVRRRILWPQAARVVIPGTLARIVTTVKVSALVAVVPLTTDLYGRSVKTAELAHRAVPLLLDAATWYLVIVSALSAVRWMIGRALNRTPRRPEPMPRPEAARP